jgi:hypothetical protein
MEHILGPVQPPTQNVRVVLCKGINWLGREAVQSPTTNAEVQKTQIYITTPQHIFIT